ncbi:hypothetical protein IACHDJAJ_00138 [Aeromonas phage vB_AdhS_TS3]|nr:hypothetical protein IACHDJAJ_00138 [Aeromonas phage vB_AdhS_TS3]
MKLETYEVGEPCGGAELCCGMCGAVMHQDQHAGSGEDHHVCSNKDCGYILACSFQYQDPPTIGVNFGFSRPNAYSIDRAKTMMVRDDPYRHKWCVVEGADGQFRLYVLN